MDVRKAIDHELRRRGSSALSGTRSRRCSSRSFGIARSENLGHGVDGPLGEGRGVDGGGLGGECEHGEIGQIVATGPPVSPGYRNRAHDGGTLRDSRLDTGDLGYRDQDGNLHIAGRTKDLIIRSGHNIDPLMIEDVMSAHPAVTMAAAVGQPDGYAGEPNASTADR